MDATALQAYLAAHIPLSTAMAAEVVVATSDLVVLKAPLAPNINHRGTAFGGSISTLATLACWSLLRVRTDDLPALPHLVVRRNNVEYLRPVHGEFSATVRFPADCDWPQFVRQLDLHKRARVTLQAEVFSEKQVAARFEGDFVALAR